METEFEQLDEFVNELIEQRANEPFFANLKEKMTPKQKRTTRFEAAKSLNAIYNAYEVRKNSLKTTYNKIWFDPCFGTWRLIGYAHDYRF